MMISKTEKSAVHVEMQDDPKKFETLRSMQY